MSIIRHSTATYVSGMLQECYVNYHFLVTLIKFTNYIWTFEKKLKQFLSTETVDSRAMHDQYRFYDSNVAMTSCQTCFFCSLLLVQILVLRISACISMEYLCQSKVL